MAPWSRRLIEFTVKAVVLTACASFVMFDADGHAIWSRHCDIAYGRTQRYGDWEDSDSQEGWRMIWFLFYVMVGFGLSPWVFDTDEPPLWVMLLLCLTWPLFVPVVMVVGFWVGYLKGLHEHWVNGGAQCGSSSGCARLSNSEGFWDGQSFIYLGDRDE